MVDVPVCEFENRFCSRTVEHQDKSELPQSGVVPIHSLRIRAGDGTRTTTFCLRSRYKFTLVKFWGHRRILWNRAQITPARLT